MARTMPGVTKERIVTEAMRLFSTRGYDATSIADVQAACGLAPGSGALYKHFPSKRALLEDAVCRDLQNMAQRRASAITDLPDDPRAALELLGSVVWAVMDSERDLIRMMIREFDGFPELFEQTWQGVIANVYRQCADWLTTLCVQNQADVADPEATSAVIIASLTYYPILDILIGHVPGEVEPGRFLAAWLDHALAALAPPARPA